MTKSELFKAAHKLARNTRAQYATYREAFAQALKIMYAAAKAPQKTITILENAGCEHWERNGQDRIYINRKAAELTKILGFHKVSSGKWERNGEWCTSTAMAAIWRDAYYDCNAQAWNFRWCNGSFGLDNAKSMWQAAFN